MSTIAETRLGLYELLFESLSACGQWEAGLAAVEQALTCLPRTMRPTLATHRAVFKARLGQDTTRDLLKLTVSATSVTMCSIHRTFTLL